MRMLSLTGLRERDNTLVSFPGNLYFGVVSDFFLTEAVPQRTRSWGCGGWMGVVDGGG